MTAEFQEDCLGLVLAPTLTTPGGDPLPVSGAAVTFVLTAPDGTRTERAGAVSGDGSAGVVYYATGSGDFDAPGTWRYQVRAATPAGQVYFSAVDKIKVKANL